MNINTDTTPFDTTPSLDEWLDGEEWSPEAEEEYWDMREEDRQEWLAGLAEEV